MSECFVYVIAAETDNCQHALLKVGISANPQGRLANFKTSSPYPLRIVDTWRLPNRAAAQWVERYTHESETFWHKNGEWFDVPFPGVADTITTGCAEWWVTVRESPVETLRAFLSYCGLSPILIDSFIKAGGWE